MIFLDLECCHLYGTLNFCSSRLFYFILLNSKKKTLVFCTFQTSNYSAIKFIFPTIAISHPRCYLYFCSIPLFMSLVFLLSLITVSGLCLFIVERIRPPKRPNAAFFSTSMKLGTIVLWDGQKLFGSNFKKFRALIALNYVLI